MNSERCHQEIELITSHGLRTACQHVQFYWEIDLEKYNAHQYVQEVLPVLYVDLIFPVRNSLSILSDSQTMHRPFISPVLNQRKTIGFPKGCRVFGIRISPFFARSLFGAPLSELDQGANDMSTILKSKFYERLNRVIDAPDPFEKRVRAIDQLLMGAVPTDNQKAQSVKFCIDKLNSENDLTIKSMSRQAGYSTRWIEKLFAEYFGNSPQQVMSIIRLNKLIEQIKVRPDARIIDYALNSGYYDHSHLIRDLNRYTGKQPKHFRRQVSSFTFTMNHL